MAKQKKDKGKKRRARTAHSGVKLLKREWASGGESWLARWTDPDTGKSREVSLTALEKHSDESRRDWAIKKSRALAVRRAQILSGEAVITQTAVAVALKDYFKAAVAEGIKPLTVVAYESGTKAFTEWAGANGLLQIEALNPAMLAWFRDWYVAIPANVPLKGKGRKSRWGVGSRKRSPASVNKGLNSMRIVLNQLRRKGLLPLLSSDGIRDSLSYVKAPLKLPKFLRAHEVKALLAACEKHDAETFDLTRDGLTDKARHISIRPFVYTALMTGMRFGELIGLKWSDVDLDEPEIRLSHAATKTGQGRVVHLAVCPSLVTMLTELKLSASEGASTVFKEITRDVAERSRDRLINKDPEVGFNAPCFTWHDLRRTCGTFLTCSNIYGGASAYQSAKRLGHSVPVAEKHYTGQVNNINPLAKSLAQVYGLEPVEVEAPKKREKRLQKVG